jgi:ParB/RepB/Spo0J family partition protein
MDNLWIPELVALEEIDPNPWQVRGEDPEHTMDVAHSISEHGLLQAGLGRRVNGRVQLAMAHTRLAAFKFLDEMLGARGNDQAGDRFAAFPVIVRELSDEQMAAYAIEENFKRKDLSGIEKARALQRYCADFGKTQAEAGERFSLGQSAVSHLLRLLELPAPVQDLVNAGALPERFARQLVSLARVAPEAVVQAAQVIAEVEPGDREDVADQQLDELLEVHGRLLEARGGCYWDADWLPSEGAVACKVCPARMTMHGENCTDLACFETRQEAWQQCELERISDKFNIPMAQAGEGKPLQIGYNNLDQVRGILKRKIKPDCLRVMAIPENAYGWSYHADALGSKVVILGSTDTLILNREQRAKEAKAAGQDALAVDDPQAQAEAEESERDERREQRAAVRRAQYDIPWLIFHTAEACGEQLQVAGAALEWMADLMIDHTKLPTGWVQHLELEEALIIAISDKGRTKEHETLTRQMLLMRRFTDQIWAGWNPPASYDWPRALKEIEEQAGKMKLRLPKDWDMPPVNKTPTNCHVCGRFMSMDHVTQRDVDEGWVVDGERVTCSDECRAAKPAIIAKKAKSPAPRKAKSKRGK